MSSTRSIKTLGLAGLMAVMAMMVVASVGAASASAVEPQFYNCQKVAKATGEYPTKAACEAGEKLNEEPREWKRAAVPAGSKIPFMSKSGVKILRSSGLLGEEVVECTADKNEGEITGPRSDTVTIKFTGCKLTKPITGACHSTSPLGGTGEIITKKLTSKLVWLKAATTTVGLDLEGEGTEKVLAEFECAGIKVKVTGSVLGVVTPLNKMAKVFLLELKCEAGKPTKQAWTMYEEPPGTFIKDNLSANGKEACEEEVTNDEITITNEAGEIRT